MTDKTDARNAEQTATSSVTIDVFKVARWFDDLRNSAARAVAWDEIEWQCTTWRTAYGSEAWQYTALFFVVSEVFGLWVYQDCDEMVVLVPLRKAREVIDLIERIGEDPVAWVWCNKGKYEGTPELRVAKAAELLGRPVDFIEENCVLMEHLGLE